MIFKHLNLYRIGGKVEQDRLEAFLSDNPFVPCLPNQERSAGFPTIVGLDRRVFSAQGCMLFNLIVQEKIIPAAAVKAEYQKSLQLQERNGVRLKREEKKALKEQVRESMLPRAFIKNTDLWAYVDNLNKLLVINTSSRKAADGLAQALRGVMDEGLIYPIRPQHDVSSRMTFWVSEDQVPEPFTMGYKCMITDGEGSIRYSKRSLEDDNLRQYLRSDMSVTEMALDFGIRSSFSLVEDFMIKDFSLSEKTLADIDQGNGEPLEQLAGDIVLMRNEVNDLLNSLLNVLGGEPASSIE
ncbi:recombination-associated protein RdgC (plasmid) [Pseudomonas sp. FeN3W]|nr:recombination-associated protein RdgC [Pseudomonas sp. FeN3W]